MSTQQCSSCRFWDRSDNSSEQVGDCRRHPPQVNTELLRAFLPGRNVDWSDLDDYVYEASAFPVSHETSWCGEFSSAATEMPL